MKMNKQKIKGFTLIEMILVLVIMSSILVMLVNLGENRFDQFRRDKAALQMQQIMNAALSYYVSNGSWPVGSVANADLGNCTLAGVETLDKKQALQTSGFLPTAINLKNPWFNIYQVSCTTDNGLNNFMVTTDTGSIGNADILVGELPLATIIANGGGTLSAVTAQVPVPGQNLNNARSINFSGIYHNGGCVPVPTCPSGMTPNIIVFPASVNGVYDQPSGCNGGNSTTAPTCSKVTTYPIQGFTAYATPFGAATVNSGPPPCNNPSGAGAVCYADIGTGGNWTQISDSTNYWRVCLQVQTPQGMIVVSGPPNPGGNDTGADIAWAGLVGSIVATTRCVPGTPPNEPVGSNVLVWTK